MLETLDNIDRILFLYFNGMHGECSDRLWYIVTNIPTWVPLYLLILIAIHMVLSGRFSLGDPLGPTGNTPLRSVYLLIYETLLRSSAAMP